MAAGDLDRTAADPVRRVGDLYLLPLATSVEELSFTEPPEAVCFAAGQFISKRGAERFLKPKNGGPKCPPRLGSYPTETAMSVAKSSAIWHPSSIGAISRENHG
jgi:hypothetical protein